MATHGALVEDRSGLAVKGITTLAGGHLLESFHDLANFAEIAGGLTFGMIVGTTIAVLILGRARAGGGRPLVL